MAKMCNNCGASNATIPLAAHELDMARNERANRRLWIVAIILIVALLASNLAWVIYESQYETAGIEAYSIEQEAYGDGANNSVIGGGNINGETND